MLEKAEVTNISGANSTIDKAYKDGKISSEDVDIMKKYYREYVNSK